MSELKVEVVEIDEIAPHPNADRLELARIAGWTCVVPKGEYTQGQRVVYLPIDSVLSAELEGRLFPPESKVKLEKSRIRTIKLRGAISQGLVISLVDAQVKLDTPVGTDVATKLGVTKYEAPEKSIPGAMKGRRAGKRSGVNSNFHKYTDIENFKHYPELFASGEPVYVSEKLHGCLQGQTKIMLPDGSVRRIKDVVDCLYPEVMGMDVQGRLVPTKVTDYFNNGKAKSWSRVQFTRKGAGSGNSFGRVICTPEHPFLNPDTREYVRAKDLKVGDPVLVARVDITYKRALVPQTITHVDHDITLDSKTCQNEYDIETETHNYIANGAVVHNTSARYGWLPTEANTMWKKVKKFFHVLPAYEFCLGSRNVQLQDKKYDGFYDTNLYGKIAEQERLHEKLEFNESVYGEIVGDGVQAGYTYGLGPKTHAFYAYDVKVNERYLDYEEFVQFCAVRRLMPVPELYVGPYDRELVDKLRSGPSTIGGQKIREGAVVKSQRERVCIIGRAVLKYINDDYLLKEQSDFH